MHNIFKIHVKNLDGSYTCNFSEMSRNTICGPISSIKNYTWANKLRADNIYMMDIGNKSSSIDILIGADVTGKLITGKKYNLKNGLTALETLLGWTVLRKLPKESKRSDTAIIITTMFLQKANICDLWRLDVIGITDSIEKTEKAIKDVQTREFLIKTARLNADGRYEVRLPWTEDHVPVSSNYDIARNRLKKGLDKLAIKNLLEAYDSVFKEWLSEGVIETVPDDEIENLDHYLSHRPVVKTNSTTKIRPVFDASACKKGYPFLN